MQPHKPNPVKQAGGDIAFYVNDNEADFVSFKLKKTYLL